MVSSVTQTIAVRASAVSRRSSGEVSGRPSGSGDTANQKTTRAITTATTRPALAATNVRVVRARRRSVEERCRAQQQRDADDRQDRRPRAAAPARPSLGEIGRRDLGIDERAGAGRRE